MWQVHHNFPLLVSRMRENDDSQWSCNELAMEQEEDEEVEVVERASIPGHSSLTSGVPRITYWFSTESPLD